MKIRHIKINNVLGIEELDTDVAPHGMLISGANGKGKTSTLRAIQMGLAAQGIDEHAIRLGAERGEIFVDLDNITVKRVITAKGTSLTVTNGDGFKASKPAALLQDLLGTGSTIDPLALFLAKPPERRKAILAALPVTVTIEQLREWVPTIPANFDCSGHGLEVIERVRQIAYDQRTRANAAAKNAKSEAASAQSAAEAFDPQAIEGATTMADARATLDRAKAFVTELDARRAAVAASVQRTEGARAKVAQLRAEADGVTVPVIDTARASQTRDAWDAVVAEIADLRTKLAAAEQKKSALDDELNEYAKVRERAEQASKRQTALRAQAATLEETLDAATPTGPSDAEIEAARAAVDTATAAMATADLAERAAVAIARSKELASAAEMAETEAARLDRIVKTLSTDAPSALLAAANGIPGLSLDGDDILLDGKSLNSLCGAEQLRFAVQIAKRTGGKAKFLLCDGVERLDPDQFDAFVREATADGWQVLATRVGRGGVTYEAIVADDVPAEAAE